MKPLTKALVVALIQVTIVCSLGAKLLYDRNTRPRAWFRAARYDPNLPIRGRYLSLRLEVKDPLSAEEIEKKLGNDHSVAGSQAARFPGANNWGWDCGSIDVRNGTPIAVFDQGTPCSNLSFSRHRVGDGTILSLNEPVLFFIPDTAQDPLHLAKGEELWVLATIPRKGPPRPISLAIKKAGEISIQPLHLN
jgi:hypothetical protein